MKLDSTGNRGDLGPAPGPGKTGRCPPEAGQQPGTTDGGEGGRISGTDANIILRLATLFMVSHAPAKTGAHSRSMAQASSSLVFEDGVDCDTALLVSSLR